METSSVPPTLFMSVESMASFYYLCLRDKHDQQGHEAHLRGPGVTYLLELLIGAAGVPQEAIRVENAAVVVHEAPQVVAGYKVLSS